MARRRGFFAELQHQQAVSAQHRQRAEAAASRDYARLARERERLQQAQLRTQLTQTRADIAASLQADKERARLHLEARANAAEMANSEVAMHVHHLDNLLAATLEVDDYVDLERLRTVGQHPTFASVHQAPLPQPVLPQALPQPTFVPPAPPSGLSSVFGKKKHEADVAHEYGKFTVIWQRWQQEANRIPGMQLEIMNAYQSAEADRAARLESDWQTYQNECAAREREVQEANARLDELIAGHAAGKQEAVEEYIGIVFGNSVYPEYFDAVTDYTYDPLAGELTIQFDLPRPDQLPTARSFRYVKAKDEIAEASQTLKEQRDRYVSVVCQVALRTLHEAWESDRAGHIRTISFTGSVVHVDPATGQQVRTPLIQLACDRSQFAALDLARISPPETLRYLNANLSKNPHGLVPIDTGQSVRGH